MISKATVLICKKLLKLSSSNKSYFGVKRAAYAALFLCGSFHFAQVFFIFFDAGTMSDSVKRDIALWLNSVVIGLNLCPFAGKPARENRVRMIVSQAVAQEEVLTDVATELELLDKTPATEIETTLIIIPDALQDFFDYTQCLQWAQSELKRQGWLGVFQLASFHPHYCFAGAEPSDDENLTNRSPYPIIHIIREASLAKALEYYADVEEIPERNKASVESLSNEEKRKLFPYLFVGN